MIKLKDNFLEDFYRARDEAVASKYYDIENPADGVVYPDICTDISPELRSEVLDKLAAIFDKPIENPMMFLRLSLAGVDAPHQAHEDSCMGEYSMMLYLNAPEDCRGGTSFLKYSRGELTMGAWERDTNNPEAWEEVKMVDMVPNRALIFSSEILHRAEPIGGFGTTPEDGRLVLTCFFGVCR